MKRIVGLLGWLGVALVVVALLLRFARPELYSWYRGLAIAGLIVTVLYALTQWRDIARSFSGRNVRYGSMTAGSIVIVLAILIAVNWISTRQNKRWDLTETGQFSLSEQTRQILRGLTRPLAIKVFYRGNTGDLDRFRDQFTEYTYTSSNVTVEYIDPDQEPMKAKALEVQAYNTVVLEYDGKVERTTSTDEQGLANALKRLIEGKAKKIYFAQGHGERDTGAGDPGGYGQFSDSLKSENFEVAKLPLAQDPKVPDDATVVIVAGPKTDYLPAEVEALRTYLGKGGKLGLWLDPPESPTSPPLTNLIAFAKEWGLTVGTDVVVDPQSINNPAFPVVIEYPPHAITEKLNRVMTAYPFTRSITPVEGGTNGRFAQKILDTSARSFAESDLKALFSTGKPELNTDKGDKAGPITIGAAITAPAANPPAPATPAEPGKPEPPKPETRLVALGDSDFISNQTINFQGNRDFALNIANWLAQQENLIAIRPTEASDRRVTMTPQQQTLAFLTSILILPALVFTAGVYAWWRRR